MDGTDDKVLRFRCGRRGCLHTFDILAQALLHAANTWHCRGCGFSDGRELSMTNYELQCQLCGPKFYKPNAVIFVDFRTKKRVLHQIIKEDKNL